MKTAKAIIKEFCHSNNDTYYYGNIVSKRVVEDIFEYQRIDENMFPKVNVSVKVFYADKVYEMDIDRFILNPLDVDDNNYTYIYADSEGELIEVSIIFDETRTKILSCVGMVYETKEDFEDDLCKCEIIDERIKASVQPITNNNN